MKLEEFKRLCSKRLNHCTSIMYGVKNDEYTRNGDKLHNFKRAASMLSSSPEEALLGMWSKHLTSILDIVKDLESDKLPSKEIVNEKFSDTINYLLLLEALITERMKGE